MSNVIVAIPEDLILSSGSHDPESGKQCLVNCAANYAPACGYEPRRNGLPFDDHQSICRVVRSFAITLNDGPWSSSKARTEALKPMVCLVLGTEGGRGLVERRIYKLVNYAFKWASDALRRKGFNEQADRMSAIVGTIIDKQSARAAEAVAWELGATRAAWAAASEFGATRAAWAAAIANEAAWAAAKAARETARTAADSILIEAADALLEICLMKEDH